MHQFFAKIARLAFSKGAAFCYAVTVGVSGQLAYNYLQPRDPAPKPVSVAMPAAMPAATPGPHSAPSSGTAVVAPIPRARLPETAPSPARPATEPATAAKPASAPPAAPPPVLPGQAALPTPVLKPVALPPSLSTVGGPVEPSTASVEPTQKPSVSAAASLAFPLETLSRHGAAEVPRATGIPEAAVAAPIPLLPSGREAEVEKAAIPVGPGPGSGGLY